MLLVGTDQYVRTGGCTEEWLRCSRLARERWWHVNHVCVFDVLGTVLFENHKQKHWLYNQNMKVCAPAMRSNRCMVFMFDDQTSKWTQVASKPSQDSPNMAPAWPNMAPSCTQEAPKKAIWLHKGSAGAMLACWQGMCVRCFANSDICTSCKTNISLISNNCK